MIRSSGSRLEEDEYKEAEAIDYDYSYIIDNQLYASACLWRNKQHFLNKRNHLKSAVQARISNAEGGAVNCNIGITKRG